MPAIGTRATPREIAAYGVLRDADAEQAAVAHAWLWLRRRPYTEERWRHLVGLIARERNAGVVRRLAAAPDAVRGEGPPRDVLATVAGLVGHARAALHDDTLAAAHLENTAIFGAGAWLVEDDVAWALERAVRSGCARAASMVAVAWLRATGPSEAVSSLVEALGRTLPRSGADDVTRLLVRAQPSPERWLAFAVVATRAASDDAEQGSASTRAADDALANEVLAVFGNPAREALVGATRRTEHADARSLMRRWLGRLAVPGGRVESR